MTNFNENANFYIDDMDEFMKKQNFSMNENEDQKRCIGQYESKSQNLLRLEVELEFVQCLANPNYLNYLAQHGYFKDRTFINYLIYLMYWTRKEYISLIRFPFALHILQALQSEKFRKQLTDSDFTNFIDDQLILYWKISGDTKKV
ncbi:Mediator complex subunit 31 [Intoshia linei]|uniref:Mediator of RNA polymerase II transcription subunit 31 n=1 Tax=Intoshia linei TaxID=1819745 RepID=A0A177B228_9BILA|nr:Mediator complex subunit 31 [Intoshia linei]